MGIERRPVPVQLIEDPLQRLALHRVDRVHQRPRLMLLDFRDRLGDQRVERPSAVGVFAREAHAQTEHRCLLLSLLSPAVVPIVPPPYGELHVFIVLPTYFQYHSPARLEDQRGREAAMQTHTPGPPEKITFERD